MKIALFGQGKMGKMIAHLAHQSGYIVVEPPDADVCIDFSHAAAVVAHAECSAHYKKPLIIGTTGWEDQEERVKEVIKKAESAALYSPNFSLGMAFFTLLLKQTQTLLSQYEIAGIEIHHSQKKDAPSGTAIAIAEALHMNTPFASVRCGKEIGTHQVMFDSSEDKITLIHQAHNREGFAKGALQAAAWIRNKTGWYTLDDMLRSLYSTHYPL